jgi:hypothetical protein
MENPSSIIKPFISGNLPKTKYTDVNELARDIAAALSINEEFLKVELIALSDLKGDKGDRGKTGPKGDRGDQGIIGPVGPAGDAFVWRGAWADATSYDIHDVVSNDNVVYISLATHTSTTDTEPGTGVDWATNWNVLFTPPSTFLSLTDTPNIFAGSGGAHLRVNVGETAIEFTTLADFASINTGTIKTDHPTGGTEVTLKIGGYDATGGAPVPTGWIPISISGVNYKIPAVLL